MKVISFGQEFIIMKFLEKKFLEEQSHGSEHLTKIFSFGLYHYMVVCCSQRLQKKSNTFINHYYPRISTVHATATEGVQGRVGECVM